MTDQQQTSSDASGPGNGRPTADAPSPDQERRTRTRVRSRNGPGAESADGVQRTRVRERTTTASEETQSSRSRSRARRPASVTSSRRSRGRRSATSRESDPEARTAAPAEGDGGAAPAETPEDDSSADRGDAPEAVETAGDESAPAGQRRRRSRRRRRGRRGSGAKRAQGPGTQEDRTARDDRDRAPAKKSKERSGASPQPGGQSDGNGNGDRAKGAGGSRSRRSGRGGGRRASTAVSDETRRAIADGPPRRMLVTEGPERTEIAVLEERDLVEHYVTRREDVSYVGNIYLGRVQNVLPGMEAAFVDIGKGRNGVLYAGEVDYDAEDLEDEIPRIEQTLKPGQPVLVQVTKDPMGTKGARLTQHLSIAGRYCVLAPGDGMLGISRKLADDERDRLRKILKAVRPDGYGLIVRTAAEGASRDQLEADVERLVRIWEGVRQRAEKAKPLSAVYEEPSLVIRVIRDVFGPEYTDLIIDSPELVEKVRDYLADVSPDMVDKVQVHIGEPLFGAYEVTNQVRRALEKKVWLASGGYLIIEKTEAMWVIDVNTGRFVGKSNLEETVLKNNLEAAEEIARQLRLRDMGGIIVIDFVDMMVPANRNEVLKRFRRELARDKTKSRVMEISKLGLVQMTRKNVSQGLTETFTTPCDCCDGRGRKIIDALT